ncbi:MAG: hypothetical protein JW938_01200 [Candidatus Omnitrophica bacterium]|nr:hypothetical protein [Candidatus Omnitrophota bacterium]
MRKLRDLLTVGCIVALCVAYMISGHEAEAFFVYENYPVSADDQFSAISSQAAQVEQSSDNEQSSGAWLMQENAVVFYGTNETSDVTFGKRTWSDCIITATIEIDQGDAAGILLHYQHERNYYKVILNRQAHTVALERMFEGQVTTLDSIEIDYLKYANKVFIDFYKDEIAVFVNGRSTILIKDDTIPYGMAGFFVENADHVVFSDPRVEYKVKRDSVLSHLTDIITSAGTSLDFPVLMDKVRIGDVMLKALELPSGAMFSNGSFSWSPREDQVGDTQVVFEAESRDGTEKEACKVNVSVFRTMAEAQAFHRVGELMLQDNEQPPVLVNNGSKPVVTSGGPKNDQEQANDRTGGVGANSAAQPEVMRKGNVDTSGISNPVTIYGGGLPYVVGGGSSNNSIIPSTLDTGKSGGSGSPVVPSNAPTAPSIPVITLVVEGLITLNWSTSSGATVYLLEQSYDDVAFSNPTLYWVNGTTKQLTVTQSGTYYFRVSAFTAPVDQGGIGSLPSNIVQVDITLSIPLQPPAQPHFIAPPVMDFDGMFTIEWSDESPSGATIYFLEQSDEGTFTAADEHWTAATHQDIQVTQAGTYYFRVTAYTENSPQGLASAPSEVVSVKVVADDTILNVMGTFLHIGVFDEYPQDSTTALTLVDDPEASEGKAYKLHYDARNQNFTGMYIKDNLVPVHDISMYKTINYRFRTDSVVNGPLRIVLELKLNGEVKGNVLISDITEQYQDISFPLYCDGGLIDEITIVILKDSDPDKLGDIFIDAIFFDEAEYVPPVTPVVPVPDQKTMTDEQLLDKLESDMAHYFYYEVIGPGFVKDSAKSSFSSVSATGFGLSALAILAEHYDVNDPLWNRVTPDDARARAYQIISHFLDMQINQDLLSDVYGKAGCFYHFIDAEGKRLDKVEVSTVDTALLLAGALMAGEYFGGEVKALADVLYANVDWTFFLNRTSQQYHMGWKPESSRDYTIYAQGGFLSNARYNVYSDEILLIAILALGNHPQDEDVLRSFYAFARDKKSYTLKHCQNTGDVLEIIPSYYGSMFTYIYGHCFFDFETLGEDKPHMVTGLGAMEPVNWWTNSVDAIRANKDFCLDRSQYFPFSLDNGNSWGFSACETPSGRYEGLFGAPPVMNGPGHDGTVAVTMPICAMPFLRTSDAEALSENPGFKAIDYYYYHFVDELYGPYGFYGSYNNKGEFSTNVLGIDTGSALLMIENYRSRLAWDTLLFNEKIRYALNRLFSESFDYFDLEIKNVGDDSGASSLDFGDNPDGTDIAVAAQYVKINFNFNDANRGIAIFTDNCNNSTYPYTGIGDAAGMVGHSDSTKVVPLYWLVFDDKMPDDYEFPFDGSFGIVLDKSMVGFYEEDAIMDRTIVNSLGELAPYPTAGLVATDTSVYVHCAADFRNADPQSYSTETLTVEMYLYD